MRWIGISQTQYGYILFQHRILITGESRAKCGTFMTHSANVCHFRESHTSPFSNPFSKNLGTSVKFKQISLDFSDRIREHLIYGPFKTCTWNSVMMKLEAILNKCQLRLQLELTLNWVGFVLCTLCSYV